MAASEQDNDDFQSIPKKKSAGKKSIYVGNLPVGSQDDDLKVKLITLFKAQAQVNVDQSDIAVHSTKTSHAIVSCTGNLDAIIRKMNRTQFEGKRLLVQRERKRKDYGDQKTAFRSWSKPSQDKEEVVVEQVITEEIQNSTDPVAIAAIAAVGMVSPVENAETEADEPSGDFLAQCQKPLSDLMAGYGDEDVNWKQVQPTSVDDTKVADKKADSVPVRTDNKLTKHGKAPIHIEFTSFGYHHGAPAELRNGWSHAKPLPAFDFRDLEEVPHYLNWQDGLSGAVKRALMYPMRHENDDRPQQPSIRKVAAGMGREVGTTVIEAINEGGHGYALPLKMVIYIGSESGRHRSVVLCELGATALRKLLRANKDSEFTQPVSVGTRHRDIERRSTVDRRSTKGPSSRKKQRDLEDD